ncbi:MAG TPA: beta-galactosidase GalA [Tepidisphaeraceae bacterium]|nr:beta-galactosidase GalA [Tepidisphaeraceae bacterium]
MKTYRFFALALILTVAAPALARQRLLMDWNWRFTLNDPADAAAQFDYPEIRDLAKAHLGQFEEEAALDAKRTDPVATNLGASVSFVQPSFDDSAWRAVDLPHDWVVELPFDRRGNESHGYKAIGPRIGNTIGWYRRKFTLPADDRGQILWIEFDGVFRNSVVWLNGHCLGRNVSGYSSFYYDISSVANFGGDNELVVRVDATRTEGWFYEGAGIYRHVWLVKNDPVHVAHWGTYVTSNVWGVNATVTATASIENDSASPANCVITAIFLDAEGREVGRSSQSALLDPGPPRNVTQRLSIVNANLWSIDHPYLYKLVTEISRDGKVVDHYETPFGIRTIRFDPDHGFFLNGKRVEICGMCNHQDAAGVGSALPDALQYFRIEKLKEMGCNAYRTSHNDPTPELLDACDKLGMLVMDEHREMGDDPEHLNQLARLIERDRNHPSVFLWSIGNEEHFIQGTPQGATVAAAMQSFVHDIDPTRPCTVAMNGQWGRGFSTVIDVQGFNYITAGNTDRFHATFPDKPCFGSEEASTLATRGAYANDRADGWMSAYDVNKPRWGSTAEHWWTYYAARPYLAGAFVWTGFDYRGEPTPYAWPNISSQFGVIDTCGFPKDDFYYYQSWWTDKPVLHLLPHWNWAGKEGQPIDVWCFSNLPSVELFLNGTSLGKQAMPVNGHLEWKVPYAPGTLEAHGINADGQTIVTKIETTGAPAKIVLTPDRTTIDADGQDVSVVTVAIADDQGRIVPTANNLVKFAIDGGGKIIGVGNGNPSSHEPDKAEQRMAFNGLCMAIVQSGKSSGTIHLTATADGLAPATAAINAQQAEITPFVQ